MLFLLKFFAALLAVTIVGGLQGYMNRVPAPKERE